MQRRTISAVLVVGLLAGCASPRFRRAEYGAVAASPHHTAACYPVEHFATVPAELGVEGPQPLDFYLDVALARNPEIQAAQRALAAQELVIPQVTALDDPMLSNRFWPFPERSPQTAMGRMPYAMMVSQEFPWFGTLRLRGEVAVQEARMALARLAQAELEVVEDVRLAYYELYFNQRASAITRENRALLEDLLGVADFRYRTGETSQQDVLRAQLELDRVDQRLIELSQETQQAQADLARLMQINPDAELEALSELEPSSVPVEIERLYLLAIYCRPELQEQLASIVREQRNEELARLRYLPNVTLGVGWDAMTANQALAPTADGMDNIGFTVDVNLPIWREKLRAGVAEARERVVENARRQDAIRDDTFRQIRRLMVQARSLDEQIQLFRNNIIPRAEQTLQVSIADYRVGRFDFLTLIDNWTQLLALEVQLVRLEANREQTLASLERVVGCTLADYVPLVADHPEEASRWEEPGEQ